MMSRVELLEQALTNANAMITDVSDELGAIIMTKDEEIKRLREGLCEYCECRLFHRPECCCTNDE